MSDSTGVSPHAVRLRPVEPRDVPVMFEHQLDPEGNRLAGTRPRGAEEFTSRWDKILQDTAVVPRVIVCGELVVGTISRFRLHEEDHVGYWIAREHWGKGIASRAMELFLAEVTTRPLHATVARANAASLRILEKCGFRITGYHMGENTERYVGCEVATLVLE